MGQCTDGERRALLLHEISYLFATGYNLGFLTIIISLIVGLGFDGGAREVYGLFRNSTACVD